MAQLIKNYFHDDKKRAALNTLTRSVFGFDFADWVRHGYDTGDYYPYSWEEDGRILSNASVNRMVFATVERCVTHVWANRHRDDGPRFPPPGAGRIAHSDDFAGYWRQL